VISSDRFKQTIADYPRVRAASVDINSVLTYIGRFGSLLREKNLIFCLSYPIFLSFVLPYIYNFKVKRKKKDGN
jgi:hypothetical protein